MKTLNSTVVIHVSDLDRSINYYSDILGFREDFKIGEYAGLILGDVCIHLSGPKNPGTKKIPGNAHVCFDCDEVDTYFESITKKDVLIVVPLNDRYYGMRDFAVNDPDGNTIVFGMSIHN